MDKIVNMESIYSKIKPYLLLHLVWRLEDFKNGRTEIIMPDNFIQCAALRLPKATTFKPHKHKYHTITDTDRVAQESWVVLSGKVKVIMYDIDDTILAEPILNTGDSSFTLHGGHNYLVLSDEAVVLEYKTGKYINQEHDKVFIKK